MLGAAVALVVYLFTALRRVSYPYELEWLEGASIVGVRRVMHGHALYTAPSPHWTPNVYGPLFYWVGALAAHITGLNFATLRVIGIVSSLILGATVFVLVRTETNEVAGPIIAAGLVYAMYQISATFYDIARVDSLFVALLFVAVLAARRTRTPVHAAGVAVLFVVATLAKQPAFYVAVAVIPWMWTRGRAVVITYTATLAGVSVSVFGALQLISHGWFWFYTWTLPAHHAILHKEFVGFWQNDLGKRLPFAIVLVAGAFVVMIRDRTTRAAWFYVPVFGALLFASYTARLHTGGAYNVLLPAYIGVAIMAGIAVGRARKLFARPAVAIAFALVVVQLVGLRYTPSRVIPTAHDEAAGNHVVKELRALRGPVRLIAQPYLLMRSGHDADTTAQLTAIQDVLRASHPGRAERRLDRELEDGIREERYCAVVVDHPLIYAEVPNDFTQYYAPGAVLRKPNEFVPVISLRVGPYQVWTPRHRHC